MMRSIIVPLELTVRLVAAARLFKLVRMVLSIHPDCLSPIHPTALRVVEGFVATHVRACACLRLAEIFINNFRVHRCRDRYTKPHCLLIDWKPLKGWAEYLPIAAERSFPRVESSGHNATQGDDSSH
jgi:hypothetical protein